MFSQESARASSPSLCPPSIISSHCLASSNNNPVGQQEALLPCLLYLWLRRLSQYRFKHWETFMLHREPLSHGSLLTSSIKSLAAGFSSCPIWVLLCWPSWMSSCLKADLKWVLLHLRTVGWKEHYAQQQRGPKKPGRLSWGWFCRCALA